VFIPEDLRVNPCVTAHSKELKLGFSEIFDKGNEEPASESGRYTTKEHKKPPGWEALGTILYDDEYTIFYLFVNEFIFAGESMGYGYRLGGGQVG
jgi:hypothetical protein